jgi:hypothetical protein
LSSFEESGVGEKLEGRVAELVYEYSVPDGRSLPPPARLAYVIGNSKSTNARSPGEDLLAAIFAHFGFELERIERMRKRQSKAVLHEAVVFMPRG